MKQGKDIKRCNCGYQQKKWQKAYKIMENE